MNGESSKSKGQGSRSQQQRRHNSITDGRVKFKLGEKRRHTFEVVKTDSRE